MFNYCNNDCSPRYMILVEDQLDGPLSKDKTKNNEQHNINPLRGFGDQG